MWRFLLINMRARLIKYEVYSCYLGYYINVWTKKPVNLGGRVGEDPENKVGRPVNIFISN